MYQEKSVINCPFCSRGQINIITTPSYRKYGKKGFKDISEQIEVLDDCPVCGKTKKEILKHLKEGSSTGKSDKKIIRRLEKSGLPTEFVQKL